MSQETFSDDERYKEIEIDDDDEYDTLIKLELIALVKENPALYAKNWKDYADKNFCKDIAWENIGRKLSRQMSGKDAAKVWYNIRQQFGRERRKIAASLKRKSGQEIKYVPKWQFYSLCLFLADHIKPRKTASKYLSNKNVEKTIGAIGKTSFFPVFISPSPSSASSSPLLQKSTLSPQALSSQASVLLSPSSDLESTCSIGDDTASSIVKESSAPVSAPSFKETQETKTSRKSTVPKPDRIPKPPDQFAKRKKTEDDLLMQVMAKQLTALTSCTTKLGEFLTTNSAQCASPSSSSVDDPILVAIGYALKSVPEKKRLECMLELLQVIKSKYVEQ